MKIIFLGTSGSMPTQNRASSGIAIKRKSEILLFDCGEGIQQRIVAARLGFQRLTNIFISHLHGDHILGLPGLLQTMTLLQREKPLKICAPVGITEFLKAFMTILGRPSFNIYINEILNDGIVHESSEYCVSAIKANHEESSWSYVFQEHPRPGKFHPDRAEAYGVPKGPLWKKLQQGEDIRLENGVVIKSRDIVDPPKKGIKIAYSGDTRPNEALVKPIYGANILIHEATFDDSLAQKAIEGGHSTATEAAEIAKKAKIGTLFLTHISSRYPDASILLEQAKKVFSNTILAEDLLEYEVTL